MAPVLEERARETTADDRADHEAGEREGARDEPFLRAAKGK